MSDEEHDTADAMYPMRSGTADPPGRGPDQNAVAKRRVVLSVTAVLASCALARALGPKFMRYLKDPDVPLLICVGVPDRLWFDPMREAAKGMIRIPVVHTWDSTARRTAGDPPVGEVVSEVTTGRAVLCLSQDVPTAVPRAIRTIADAMVTLSVPAAAEIALAISIVRNGRAPSRVPPNLGEGLDLHEIAGCFRADRASRITIDRIRRAMASKNTSGVDVTAPFLADLHGYGEAAAWGQRVVSQVEDYRAGRVAWRDVSGPAVLHGPAGTGKTLFARALARSLGVPLVATSVAAWFRSVGSGDLGATIRNANAAFDEARALVRDGGVAVLFIDEIDSLPDRGALDADAGSWWRPVVNQVLMLVDGATSDLRGIVLIAATNHIHAVDPALLRPGRFGTLLEVLPPSVEDLAGIVRHHLGGTDCPLATSDVTAVLRPLTGATQARAAAWAAEAARSARAAGRPVCLDDLASAVLPVDGRPEVQRRRIAVHEGGHAVAAYHMARDRFVSVSIVEAAGTHGSTTMVVRDESLLDRAEIETEVVITLGGRAADLIVGSGANAGAGGSGRGSDSSDLAVATRLLTAVHASYGLGLTLRHRGGMVGGRPDEEVARLVEEDLQRLMARAEAFMTARRAEVRAVAEALLRRRFLSAAEVGDVVAAANRTTPTAAA